VAAADLDFGPGITVRRVLSSSPTEVIAEVDVAANAASGKRDVALGHTVLANATAVYDSIDAVKVLPGTAVSRLGGGGSPRPKGYQQFEAIAYQRGPDNKPGTADDVELGPVDVTWSVEEFYQNFDDDDKEFVGSLGSKGLFTPSIDGPNPRRKFMADNHGNVWIVATTRDEKDKNGKPLIGRSYLVVAPPLYIIWDKDIEQ
jgi:quinohemoprotein amine dehydrogenase